jgi:hypothetical protein
MAALQGGYLLAQANHDAAPMATALDMALTHIESLTTRPLKTATPRSKPRSARNADSAQPRRKTAPPKR